MNTLMLTNVYTPVVGGVTRSIQAFTQRYRERGHGVLIVAPSFGKDPPPEEGVVRIPSIPNVYKRRYPLPLPIPGYLFGTIRDFQPDVIHSHHPFLLGGTAQRGAVFWDLPLVYTHHTRYRAYVEQDRRGRAAVDFLKGITRAYCDSCDVLIAPSRSMARLLEEDGVRRRIEVVPTGVDFDRFSEGDGAGFRKRAGIPERAPVIGYVGRLEPEKNWDFLAPTVAEYLATNGDARFLVVGQGSWEERIRQAFHTQTLGDRLHMPGVLDGRELVDAYHAMDVFAFASHTETQGMVITEAMAAGVPVVAIESSGVRDVLEDERNGRMVHNECGEDFIAALDWVLQLPEDRRHQLQDAAHETARRNSMARSTERTLQLYEQAIAARQGNDRRGEQNTWPLRLLNHQWKTWTRLLEDVGSALFRDRQL